MKILIEIDTDNDAFQPEGTVGSYTGNADAEVADILHSLARTIHGAEFTIEAGASMRLLDTNGNTCGKVTVTD